MPLFDYFRAPDADAVREAMDAGDARSPMGEVFDGVEAKHVDPAVVLGTLVAAIRRWCGPPAGNTTSTTRAHGCPSWALREWARTEELGGHVDVADAQAFIETVVELARRAREADEHLFCWMSL